jgi:uncharacterized phage infection (PIP) family protein YhgE
MAQDNDAIKEEMHKLTARAAQYSNEAVRESDTAKRKILDDNVSRLNAEIQALADKIPEKKSAGAPKRFAKKPGPVNRLIPGGLFEARRKAEPDKPAKQVLQEMRNEPVMRVPRKLKRSTQQTAQAVKEAAQSISKTPEKVIKQSKSSAEKLTDLALKEAQRTDQQRRNPQLPAISRDTATEVVIASIAAIFLILAGAGVKFSELWSLAFNPNAKGAGVGDYSGTGPGGTPDDSWDIPNPFHGVA